MGFPAGTSRSTAVVSSCLASSEDPGEYKDYFNPRIYPRHSLYTSNPVFATAVNIRSHQRPQNMPNSIETVCRHPWDNHPYGQNTRSQEALCRRAEKKIAKCFPSYKD